MQNIWYVFLDFFPRNEPTKDNSLWGFPFYSNDDGLTYLLLREKERKQMFLMLFSVILPSEKLACLYSALRANYELVFFAGN